MGLPVANGGSIDFTNSIQYALVQYGGQSQFAFGTGDYTVELWLKVIGGDGITFALSTYYQDGLQFYNNNTGAAIIATLASGPRAIGSISYGAWTYYAFVRNAGTTTAYINGSSVYSFADSTNYTTTTGFPRFGDPGYGTDPIHQRMTNIRIVKGTAVYTSNFTPPTAPLTAIPNTSLLLNAINAAAYLTDSSTNNFVPTTTGLVTWSSDSPYP